MPQTEFEVMFRSVLMRLVRIFPEDAIRIGKRVKDRYMDVSIHLPHKNIEETRPVICLEVKKTSTSGLTECIKEKRRTRNLELSVSQALGYARANHFIRNGIQVRPVCVLIDSDYMAILDVEKTWEQNIEEFLSYPADYIFETTEDNFRSFFSDLNKPNVEALIGPDPHTPFRPLIRQSFKDEATCDNKLANNLLRTYKIFSSKRIAPQKAIDYTIQCFLLAVLRNCGFISVPEIDYNLSHGQDRKWLLETLKYWFSSNFLNVPNSVVGIFIDAYNTTRTYDVRVDAMPQEAIGYAYERFIRYAKQDSSTEFYTPDLLIQDVLKETQPTKVDILFDPTCGCGSFLIGAIRQLFKGDVSTKSQINGLSRFLTQNVYGNDRDFYATCITKAALLSFFVEKLGVDPTESKVKLPIIKNNITTQNYFTFKWSHKKKPTLVLGNAPWGFVSSAGKTFKKLIADKAIWKSIMKIRGLGDDDHELSGSVILKCIDDFSKTKGFRMGVLVKQQLLVENKDRFLTDDRAKACYFFDYGPKFLFAHTNALTGIAFFKKGKSFKITSKFDSPFNSWHTTIPLRNYFSNVIQGQQTGKNPVWRDLAKNKALSSLRVEMLDSLQKTLPLQKLSTSNLIYVAPPPRLMKRKAKTEEEAKLQSEYIKNYDLLLKALTGQHKKELSKVTTGAKTKKGKKVSKAGSRFAYTWRRPIPSEVLENRTKLIFPNAFTGVKRGSRLPLAITSDKILGKTSHTLAIFNDMATEKLRVNIIAWLSSTYLAEMLEWLAANQKIKRLSGGYELLPEYASQLLIPKSVLESDSLYAIGKSLLTKSKVTEDDLIRIDAEVQSIVNPSKRGVLFAEVV